MKKIAIFVEGDTELHFITKLVQEVAGYENVRLILSKQHSGNCHILRTVGAPDGIAQFLIQIVNCCCDGKVKPYILERRQLLLSQGYKCILGLQDLFPKGIEELERFEDGLASGLVHPEMTIRIAIAVKEIEAWFLSESSHYARIDSGLEREIIKASVGFDPWVDNAETEVNHPAVMLDKIYQAAGLGYKKTEADVMRVLSALDFVALYDTVRLKSRSLGKFLDCLDEFMVIEAA